MSEQSIEHWMQACAELEAENTALLREVAALLNKLDIPYYELEENLSLWAPPDGAIKFLRADREAAGDD